MTFVVLLGLVLGSFVNALVWRIYEQENGDNYKQSRNKKTLNKSELSILSGRSMCPKCHHVLAAKDLIPVLSWLLLRGKCRYCHSPISRQYPVVELITAGLFGVSYIIWPTQFDGIGYLQFAFWLVFLTLFVALAVYDMKWMELPDVIVWPLVLLAVVQVALLAVIGAGKVDVVQVLLSIVTITGLFGALYALSGGRWIGFGDVKLSIALAILVGTPLKAFLVIFVASIIGTLVSVPTLLGSKGSKKSQVPFGPALILATFIVFFWGGRIIGWYLGLLN